ncbi:hypothetical protein [Halomonas sp. HAL1]|uniref:hypothetical protein n=1 Tax=Halomonas sp. HAL1 TaxID=550984 RepID=UPI00022D2B71|nr:hypothetical protein [Halomonas sp. HAL1]EHA14779.1 hypothetical protein HAL1_14457 [Halomonas sp. HAL1]WKV93314.1 hypothetical protein Q3Y66_01355 [Halomonas sp. HAL1]
MKLLNRQEQKELLWHLAEQYPNSATGLFDVQNIESPTSVNLHYLDGHGLVKLGRPRQEAAESGRNIKMRALGVGLDLDGSAKITEKGLDFLQADGGLTAILRVVTIKLHNETLSELEGKILASKTLPQKEKSRLLDRLRGLTDEGAKTLVNEMVKAGLSRGSEVWETALRFLSN